MNAKAALESAAVAASAPVTLATAGLDDTIVSMAVGLVGVWLARIVFVNRENRRLERPQEWKETLPVTLAACLIAGAVIYDQDFGISASAFTGLGCGWTTVVLLEFAGDRAMNSLRALFGAAPLPPQHPGPVATEVYPNVPEDMAELLKEADEVDPDYKPPEHPGPPKQR